MNDLYKKINFGKFSGALVLVLFCFAACKNNTTETAESPTSTVVEEAPLNLPETDLKSFGFPIIIKTPQGATVEQNSAGGIEIKSTGFMVNIGEGTGDLALLKNDLKEDEVNKLKRIIIDEPNALLYETEIVAPEFHFIYVIKKGKTVYEIQDIKGNTFTEDEARLMLRAAKSVKLN